MNERQRTQLMWGIWNGEELLPFTMRDTRERTITDFCQNSGYDIPEGVTDVWRWLKRRGNECVRVTAVFEAHAAPTE